jgi:hypothetical protein
MFVRTAIVTLQLQIDAIKLLFFDCYLVLIINFRLWQTNRSLLITITFNTFVTALDSRINAKMHLIIWFIFNMQRKNGVSSFFMSLLVHTSMDWGNHFLIQDSMYYGPTWVTRCVVGAGVLCSIPVPCSQPTDLAGPIFICWRLCRFLPREAAHLAALDFFRAVHTIRITKSHSMHTNT